MMMQAGAGLHKSNGIASEKPTVPARAIGKAQLTYLISGRLRDVRNAGGMGTYPKPAVVSQFESSQRLVTLKGSCNYTQDPFRVTRLGEQFSN